MKAADKKKVIDTFEKIQTEEHSKSLKERYWKTKYVEAVTDKPDQKSGKSTGTAKEEKTTTRIISTTKGLAEYLNIGNSLASAIITSGILKDAGIQYWAGHRWKFNAEKLDKYLEDNGDALKNIRCKRKKRG